MVAAATAGLLTIFGPRLLKIELEQGWIFIFSVAVMLLAWQWVLVEAIRGLGELRWASLFAGGQSGGPISTLLFVAGLTILTRSWRCQRDAGPGDLRRGLCGHAARHCVVFAIGLAQTAQSLERSDSAPHRCSLSSRDVLALSLPICGAQLLAYLTLSADLPIANFYCQPEDVALLGQTRRLILVLQLPIQMVVMTILPAVARLYAEGNITALEQLVRKATTYGALFTLAAASVLLIAPGPVLALLFGEYYRQAAPLLVALSLSQLIAAHNGMGAYVLMMAGRLRCVVASNALTAVLMVSLGPVAAYYSGILGLAIASAAILSLQNTLDWWSARRLLQVSSHFDWRYVSELLSFNKKLPS